MKKTLSDSTRYSGTGRRLGHIAQAMMFFSAGGYKNGL